eukprot:SAG22_NODE_355_length_11775_cov_76.400651_8_plen_153_part_00
MQRLVAKDKEPITPFIAKVRPLSRQHGISSVLVIGGSGDYFAVADTVIMMDCYAPHDVTAEAQRISAEMLTPDGERRLRHCLSFCRAFTALLSKTVPFLAVCLSFRARGRPGRRRLPAGALSSSPSYNRLASLVQASSSGALPPWFPARMVP